MMHAGPSNHRSSPSYRRVDEQQASSDDMVGQAVIAPPQFASVSIDKRHHPLVTPRHGWYLPVKAAFDFVAAAILLLISAPLIVLGAVLVKLTSPGPWLFRQVRLGKDGRPFTLLKLRTMKLNAEAETGPVWSTGGNDSRVTPIGKLLRQTHIDEFPQLWNILKGEMSLIGPRPERPEFVAKLEWEVPFYRERLKVRPGITGLAQMRLPADTTIESVQRKVVHDIYYVRHVNPALDGKLLIKTAWRLVAEIIRFCWHAAVLPSGTDVESGFRRTVGISPDDSAVASFRPTLDQSGKETDIELPEVHSVDHAK